MSALNLTLDNHDLQEFSKLCAQFGQQQYGYVVTPNVDHLIRFHDEPGFRELYEAARYVLLDSRFLAKILRRTHGMDIKVCTGSDLTAHLFNQLVAPTGNIVLIGGTEQQAARLRERYQLQQLFHFNPPMGFIKQPAEVERCLNFIESHSPFCFCLLAVGCPQQEIIAHQLKLRDRARGLALCIGASINFITGNERRAPAWIQKTGCEWLFRLLQDPKRLARRYLVRGPRIFRLLPKFKISLRNSSIPTDSHSDSPDRLRSTSSRSS